MLNEKLDKIEHFKELIKLDQFSELALTAKKYNLSLADLDYNGESLNHILTQQLYLNLSYNSQKKPNTQLYIKDLLDFLLHKNPEFWLVKHNLPTEQYTWLSAYIVFNDINTINNVFDQFPHMRKINLLKFTSCQKSSFELIKCLYNNINIDTITIPELYQIITFHKEEIKDIFDFFKNKKIIFDKELFFYNIRQLFSTLISKNDNEFNLLFGTSIEFFQTQLIKNFNKEPKIIPIIRNIFSNMLYDDKKFSLNNIDKTYVINALSILKTQFPEIDENLYIKEICRFQFTLYGLGFSLDKNKNSDTSLCSNYTAFLMSHHLTNTPLDQILALKNLQPLNDYFIMNPNQVLQDIESLKQACEKAGCEFKSTNDNINNFISYVNLQQNLSTHQNNSRKIKI